MKRMLMSMTCVAFLFTACSTPRVKLVQAGDVWEQWEDGGDKICATWYWQSATDARATWQNGTQADLKIRCNKPGVIVIERKDESGVKKGLTAVYMGKLVNKKIEGQVSWLEPDGSVAYGIWSATPDNEDKARARERDVTIDTAQK